MGIHRVKNKLRIIRIRNMNWSNWSQSWYCFIASNIWLESAESACVIDAPRLNIQGEDMACVFKKWMVRGSRCCKNTSKGSPFWAYYIFINKFSEKNYGGVLFYDPSPPCVHLWLLLASLDSTQIPNNEIFKESSKKRELRILSFCGYQWLYHYG